MAPEFFNPEEIAPSPVNLYNHVVKVGNTVYIAGQVSRGLDGNTIHKGDAAAQIQSGLGKSGTGNPGGRRHAQGHRQDHNLCGRGRKPGEDPPRSPGTTP